MHSAGPAGDEVLPRADLLMVDRVCDRFEAACARASGLISRRSWRRRPGRRGRICSARCWPSSSSFCFRATADRKRPLTTSGFPNISTPSMPCSRASGWAAERLWTRRSRPRSRRPRSPPPHSRPCDPPVTRSEASLAAAGWASSTSRGSWR